MSEAALNPGAAMPPPPAGAPSDAVGVTTKKVAANTFKGQVAEGTVQPGVVVGMESVTSPNKFKPGETRDQCLWSFAIEGREAEGTFGYYTSFSLHEKSSLPPLLAALQRPAPAVGEPLRKSAYVGAKCGLLIETPDGKQYQKITKVLKRS